MFTLPVNILDGKIINVNDIQMVPSEFNSSRGNISFKHSGKYNRINFSSCWNGRESERDYLDNKTYETESFAIPIIPYISEHNTHHLIIDMFNNDCVFRTLSTPVLRQFHKDRSSTNFDHDPNSDDPNSDDHGSNSDDDSIHNVLTYEDIDTDDDTKDINTIDGL